MSEVSHLPQLVKVQKESLKETIEFEWSTNIKVWYQISLLD